MMLRNYLEIPKIQKPTADYQAIDFLNVTPPGFEPRSKEPESSILSIKLWGRLLCCKCNNNLVTALRRKRNGPKNNANFTAISFCLTSQ